MSYSLCVSCVSCVPPFLTLSFSLVRTQNLPPPLPPTSYLMRDKTLFQAFRRAQMTPPEAAASAELLAGTAMFHHFFYLRSREHSTYTGRGQRKEQRSGDMETGRPSDAGDAHDASSGSEGSVGSGGGGGNNGNGGSGGGASRPGGPRQVGAGAASGGGTDAAAAGRRMSSAPPNRMASPEDIDLVPVPVFFHGPLLAKLVKGGNRWLPWKLHHLDLVFPLPANTSRIVSLIDGVRTIREIYETQAGIPTGAPLHTADTAEGEEEDVYGSRGGDGSGGAPRHVAPRWNRRTHGAGGGGLEPLSWDEFRRQFAQLFTTLNGINKLLLSSRPVRTWTDHEGGQPGLMVANPRPPNHYHVPLTCGLLRPNPDPNQPHHHQTPHSEL